MGLILPNSTSCAASWRCAPALLRVPVASGMLATRHFHLDSSGQKSKVCPDKEVARSVLTASDSGHRLSVLSTATSWSACRLMCQVYLQHALYATCSRCCAGPVPPGTTSAPCPSNLPSCASLQDCMRLGMQTSWSILTKRDPFVIKELRCPVLVRKIPHAAARVADELCRTFSRVAALASCLLLLKLLQLRLPVPHMMRKGMRQSKSCSCRCRATARGCTRVAPCAL